MKINTGKYREQQRVSAATSRRSELTPGQPAPLAVSQPQAAQMKDLQKLANNSATARQLKAMQQLAGNSPDVKRIKDFVILANNGQQKKSAMQLRKTAGELVISEQTAAQRLPFEVKLKDIAWDHIEKNHFPGVGKENKSVFMVDKVAVDEMIYATLMMGRDKGLVTLQQVGGDSFSLTEEADEYTGWDQDGNFTKGIRIAVKVKNDDGDCDVISAYPHKL